MMRVSIGLLLVTFSTAALADTVDVRIQGFAYRPNQITVTAGTTVRWTNMDGIEHTVTSQTGPGTLVPSGLFNSGLMDFHATFEFTFTELGVIDYFCIPHGSSMQGRVTVVAPAPCPADLNGDRTIDLSDLAQLLAAFGASSGEPAFDADADLNASGTVDLTDLAQLLSVFGEPCP